MPYTQDPLVIKQLADGVLATEDISQQLQTAEINKKKLISSVEHAAPDIWASAAPRITEYNDAEKKTESLRREYGSIRRHRPYYVTLVEDTLPSAFGLLVLSLFALFSATVRHFISSTVAQRLPWILGILVGLAPLLLVLWLANRSKVAAYRAALKTADAAVDLSVAEAAKNKTLIEAAITTAIESHVREYIDEAAQPVFRLDLPETETAGLSEVHSDEFEIITDGRRYVRGLIEKMSGGSIGIAGPRGSGKTTLLRSFWQEGVAHPKKLSMFASAPVKYEPREFLLHLFTSLCSHVIAKERRTEVPPAWTQMDDLRRMPTPRLFGIEILASLMLTTALFLLFTGFAVAIVESSSRKPASTAASPRSSQNSQNPETTSSNPFSAPAIPYFIWGVAALIVGVGARFSPGQPRPTNPLEFFFSAWARKHKREEVERQTQLPSDVDPDVAKLIQRAQRTLLGLRFQQSYSSGWSGALKLPIGLEGGANTAVSFAESQLSLPELVSEYRSFLREAAKRYDQILIAIDELDKLASDEEAKTFLNSIKAIFGQERVYYLVSISENAISNFERRGLPIRDEFDSSFDDAVYIGYLSAVGSRRLLARRVSEPPPHVYRAFCHVVSGGLPRDLIRSCRKLYDYRRSNPTQTNSVAVTCPELVRRDIKAKLEAIRHDLQRVRDAKKTVDVLTLISTNEWDQHALLDAIVKLDTLHASIESEAAASNQAREGSGNELSALAGILEEINAYLRFSFSVNETFGSIDGEARYRQLEQGGVFERLAVVRQWMSVNRAAAIAMTSQIAKLPVQPATTAGEVGKKAPTPESAVQSQTDTTDSRARRAEAGA